MASGDLQPDGIDRGTAVLLPEVPDRRGGRIPDLGCGFGAAGVDAGPARPGVQVWAVDVNERALDLLRRNALWLSLSGVRAGTASSVPTKYAST